MKMERDELKKQLELFKKEYQQIFGKMTDQKLVDSHNSACKIKAWGLFVAVYTEARKEELLKRFPDTTNVIEKKGDESYSYNLRPRGVWIAYINGVKTLACSELDDQPPTKPKTEPFNKDPDGHQLDSMSLN